MKEHPQVRQMPGEPKRRWFSSNEFDLIVWQHADGDFAGFELCYDKTHNEHSLTWRPTSGFTHTAIDDGEQSPGRYKSAPIHLADVAFDAGRIHAAFAIESRHLPKEIAEYVLLAIEQYPGFSKTPQS